MAVTFRVASRVGTYFNLVATFAVVGHLNAYVRDRLVEFLNYLPPLFHTVPILDIGGRISRLVLGYLTQGHCKSAPLHLPTEAQLFGSFLMR